MLHRTQFVLMLIMAAAVVALGIVLWPRMPEQAAIHYNLAGEADSWGPRWIVALAMPLLNAALGLLFWALPRVGPFRKNLERFSSSYSHVALAIHAAISAVVALIVLKNAGAPVDIGRSVAITIGLMLLVIGNLSSKMQRNFWMGIRTPWTLANETVWYRTHRVGGRLLMFVGLATVAAAIFWPGLVCFIILIGGTIITLVWSLLYSYLQYRSLGCRDDLHPADLATPIKEH